MDYKQGYQLFKKWILQPNNHIRERYVKQRNRVIKVVKKAKRGHIEEVLGENPKAKSAQKRNENQPANLPSAQVLNDHFTEIGLAYLQESNHKINWIETSTQWLLAPPTRKK